METRENFNCRTMRVACLHDHFGAIGELDEIDARAPVDGGPGGENGVALAGRDIDARALADEIVAEPLDVDIGDELTCAECGSLLRVASDSPLEFELADEDDDLDEDDDEEEKDEEESGDDDEDDDGCISPSAAPLTFQPPRERP